MRIVLDLPNWVEERHLYVSVDEQGNLYALAGVELAAFKHVGKAWQVKTSRCSACGKCCERFSIDRKDKFFGVKKGVCVHLEKEIGGQKLCGLGSARPFSCSITSGYPRIPECTERFEEVDVS